MEQGRESLLALIGRHLAINTQYSAIKFNSKKRDGLNRDISL